MAHAIERPRRRDWRRRDGGGPQSEGRGAARASLVASRRAESVGAPLVLSLIPVSPHPRAQQRGRAQDAGAVCGGRPSRAVTCILLRPGPPLLAISRPPDFLSFHRLSLLLRPFSLSISRKIITSGRWGGGLADTRRRAPACLAVEAMGPAGGVPRGVGTATWRSAGSGAIGARDETLLHIVGWIPPPPEGRSERHTTAPRSVRTPPQGAQNGCQDSATPAVSPRTAPAPRAGNPA